MPIDSNYLLSSHEAADLLQMDASSIVKWVNDGLLPAYRTPGNHRRIRTCDFVSFLRHHGMFIPAELAQVQSTVLVVDDDENFLRALTRSMKSHPEYQLSTAASGIDALVRIGAQPPAALVMDVHMPEMDGLDVLRALKASPATKNIAVLMMTGKPSADLEKKALDLGAKAVLAKPVTAGALADAINRRV
jgi:excisionase family DNA binding protein